MRFFFRSRQFKIIVAVFAALVILTGIFGIIGRRMSPQTDIASTLTAPIRQLFSNISITVSEFVHNYNNTNELSLENSELKAEVDELRNQLADYNDVLAENDYYKNYLEIKDENPDFKFCDATLISRDLDDPFGSFTINKGSSAGIKKHDPVITDGGVVGFVSEVGLISSKVTTILSPDITMGALDNRTKDSGIVTGNITLAENGMCRFANLSRSCHVAIGDYVVTSGEGIFPEGLLIGSIESIGSDTYNTSIFAEIKPFVSIDEVSEVMVITSFEGQGGIAVGKQD